MHELDAYCDRSVERFLPIRVCAYSEENEAFKIPLRSMPYMIKTSLYRQMRGYWPLSKHRLVWGGGDFLISFKPLLLGYDNWVLTNYGVVHLGPYPDKRHFIDSFLTTASATYPRFVGMLTAAYVIGGKELLATRFKQLINRVTDKKELIRMSNQAAQFGVEERRWIKENAKVAYNEVVNKFYNIQGNNKCIVYECEDLLPETKIDIVDNYDPRKHSKRRNSKLVIRRKSDWRARIRRHNEHLCK
jgi:hypothetical protein